ncbi:4-(cytidine 5'-diphospho)-2-C-methyl-D-erythritol kinase [Fibrobacterota bacterium]
MRITLYCRAKINLFLEIVNKRPDGYHNIRTLFQTLACSDVLSAEPYHKIALEGGDGITKTPGENLIIKAAEAVKKRYGITSGIKFFLKKTLPVQAGLGGGSSNAAGALKLCRKIWDLDVPVQDLQILAGKLGADVPFLLREGTCFAAGKGELLEPAPPPYRFYVVVATPECFVDTANAYGKIDLKETGQRYPEFKRNYLMEHKNPDFFKNLKNSFEEFVFKDYPIIRSLRESIGLFHPIHVMLCGSGASLFGLFKEKSSAEQCRQFIKKNCRYACVTEFSPK